MTARKDLRTAETEWRATPVRRSAQRAPKPAARGRLTAAGIVCALIGLALAVASLLNPVQAQDFEAAQVLQDRGWHGVGGDMQAQATTADARAAPIVAVWTREPMQVPNGVDPYGHWLYVKWLLECDTGQVLNYALLDDADRVVLVRDVLGYTLPMETPTGDMARITRGVCRTYGFAP